MSPRDEAVDGWHVNRTLTISHLLVTLSLLVSSIWWAADMSSRLVSVEEHVKGYDNIQQRVSGLETLVNINARDNEKQDAERLRMVKDVRDELARLNAKMDRLIESRNGG